MKTGKVKFRAWHKKLKIMCGVVAINFYCGNVVLLAIGEEQQKLFKKMNAEVFIESDNRLSVSMEDVELMQYTNLNDVSSIEIYRNDILEDEYGDLYKIEFEICKFVANRLDGKGGNFICPQMRWWKIKGNIYQNSDLLKEVK